ncbi:hypothetical protein ACFYY1_20490 [Streptomyces sp. NPDC001890]|uniref:hypothetical protein n=1 Tax=Streptomyces sp. NPDC001890 TaxID=3364620 RepID=UPI0036AC29B1
MHFELHRIRSRELIREADAYRLARQAGKTEPAPRSRPARTWPTWRTWRTWRPVPRRLPARLRR